MKKVISAALCLVMALSLSAAVLADEYGNSDAGSTSRDVHRADNTTFYSASVSFTVAPVYTVTIPATVTLGGTPLPSDTTTVGAFTGTGTVSVSDTVLLANGEVIYVDINEESDNFVATLTGSTSVTVGYTVKRGSETASLRRNSNVATFSYSNKGSSADVTLNFANSDEIRYAGTYTGSLHFKIGTREAS